MRSSALILFPFLLVFFEIITYLANDMYLPALPMLAADLNVKAHMAELTLTAWFLGSASLQLILGPLSDRIGRRPVLLGGAVIFTTATLVCTLTANINILLIARFFQGCSVCAVVTAGYSSIHESFDTFKAIQILALMGSITVLAPAFGPFFGAVILQWLSWRWIFGILFILGLIALLLLWWIMPESNLPENRDAFHLKTIVKNYKTIICNLTFLYNTLLFCLTFLGMIAWITLGPFLVINTFHYNPLMFGVFQVLVFGCLIVGAQIVKHLIDRVGIQPLINVGLIIIFAGSIIGVISTLLFPHFLWGLIISLMIYAFGASLAFSPSHRVAVESCNEPMGARMAIFSGMMALFGVLGSLLVSLTYTGSIRWLSSLLIVTALLACLMRWLDKSHKNKAVSL